MAPEDATYDQLNQVHTAVLSVFKNLPDVGEEWKMPPANFDGSQTIRDDCDGFCLAVRKLLRNMQIPSRLVYCEVGSIGHLVVEVNGWISDNRQKYVVSNRVLIGMNYKFKRISGFKPGDPWREIVG